MSTENEQTTKMVSTSLDKMKQCRISCLKGHLANIFYWFHTSHTIETKFLSNYIWNKYETLKSMSNVLLWIYKWIDFFCYCCLFFVVVFVGQLRSKSIVYCVSSIFSSFTVVSFSISTGFSSFLSSGFS